MLLHDKLKDFRLLLASHSPRRRQLLTDCGLDFELIDKYDVEELYPSDMASEQVPLYLSQLKSRGYTAPLADNEILITADTVVVADGAILGKPSDEDDARAMLSRLSGVRHRVVTGVTLRSVACEQSFSAASDVWFRPLSEEEIAYYVATFKPLDKAGSYGIQEWIGYVAIEKIEGSFYNVMGLPIQKLYVRLDSFIDEITTLKQQ